MIKLKLKKISLKFTIFGILISFLITSLFAGLSIAEKNTRTLGFNKDYPFYSIELDENNNHFLQIYLFGNDYKINFEAQYKTIDIISDKTYNFIKNVVNL